MKKIICCNEGLEFKVQFWWKGHEDYKPEQVTCKQCDTYYAKKEESNIVYKMNEDKSYNCLDCNEKIMGITVWHPVHDGFFKGSGSGSVRAERVPYCPKCEEMPDPKGLPIDETWGT